jgi:hypothetical protein
MKRIITWPCECLLYIAVGMIHLASVCHWLGKQLIAGAQSLTLTAQEILAGVGAL